MRSLLESGADVHARGVTGRHTEVVRLLVDAGADVNLADGEGVTPLAHARRQGFAAIAEIVVRAGGGSREVRTALETPLNRHANKNGKQVGER